MSTLVAGNRKVRDGGRLLAQRLGLTIDGREGHDLTGPCIACDSSDAFRLHEDTGVAQCYSCSRAWSPFDLAKVVRGDQGAAVEDMTAVGFFDGTPSANGDDWEAVVREWETKKGVPRGGFAKFRPKVGRGQSLIFPMYGPDWKACSTCRLSDKFPKGRYEKGKPVGLFFPGKRPEPGQTWILVEGVKDAGALVALGHNAAGLPGNHLHPKFAEMFEGVDVVVLPDGDKAGISGALDSAKALQGKAASVRIALLPVEIEESGGQDVRDVLKAYGDRGPDAIRNAIDQAVAPEEMAKRFELKTSEPVQFQVFTLPELLAAQFETRYLVDGILIAGQPCILAGPKKSLKTSLLLDLGIGLAAGKYFLGRFACPEAVPVGIMTGESGLATVQETARRICNAAGYNAAAIDGLVITDRVPRFGDPSYEEAFGAFIESRKLQVVVVDPAYMALPGDDAGNMFVQGSLLRNASEICQSRGCTLILAHHTRKNAQNPYSPPELEDIAWAGFQEFARQWLLVNRRCPYEPGTGSHKLWLSWGGSAGHGGLKAVDVEEGVASTGRFWDVDVLETEEARQAAAKQREKAKAEAQSEKLDDEIRKAAEALMAYPDGETKNVLRTRAGLSGTKFDAVLAEMMKRGQVEACAVFKSNWKNPIDGFKLAAGQFEE